MIRALLGFTRRSDTYVSLRGHAVHNGMHNNPNFPNPPVNLDDLQVALVNFDQSIAAASDGGKRALTEKKACREAVAAMLRQLGHYVEAACKGDMVIFLSSGFEPVRAPGATEPCSIPRILKIRQGRSGELFVSFTPHYRKAAHYQLRYGVQGARGTPPETWTIETFLQARRAVSIDNLTPFQVRAFGKTGVYTEWSDSTTRMCI